MTELEERVAELGVGQRHARLQGHGLHQRLGGLGVAAKAVQGLAEIGVGRAGSGIGGDGAPHQVQALLHLARLEGDQPGKMQGLGMIGFPRQHRAIGLPGLGQAALLVEGPGLPEKRILYGHIFRNAMLIVIAGFPAAFVAIFFTGSILIEVIFSLDGIGLLGYESVINRDYPVVLGTLYVFALVGLLMSLLRELIYMAVDPRIDFEARHV